MFLSNLAIKLLKNTSIIKHVIEQENNKHLTYSLIYSLEPIKLEILKTYIKIHLKTGLIQCFKSPESAFILLNKKPNSSFYWYVNNSGLNNLIIKN